MFDGKRILVTGGAGFIGSNLVRRRVESGARVRATVHVHPPVIRDDRIEYVSADLTQAEDTARVCQGMDLVFLCAAVTSGAAVMATRPLAHLTPNLVMNARMLEAAYEAGVKKVLFISSNTVYPVTDTPVVETDVTNEFFDKYFIVAWMKRFSEIMCDMYSRHVKRGMTTVVVRPANAYGPFDDFEWETSHVLPALMRKVIERHAPLEVWGDGRDVKDFIYVDDLVEGLMLAMEYIDSYDPVNLASGKGYCLRDLLTIMLEIDGYPKAEVVFDASKPTMIPRRLINPDKARRRLGFEARTDIREGLKRTMAWYRASHGLPSAGCP